MSKYKFNRKWLFGEATTGKHSERNLCQGMLEVFSSPLLYLFFRIFQF